MQQLYLQFKTQQAKKNLEFQFFSHLPSSNYKCNCPCQQDFNSFQTIKACNVTHLYLIWEILLLIEKAIIELIVCCETDFGYFFLKYGKVERSNSENMFQFLKISPLKAAAEYFPFFDIHLPFVIVVLFFDHWSLQLLYKKIWTKE